MNLHPPGDTPTPRHLPTRDSFPNGSPENVSEDDGRPARPGGEIGLWAIFVAFAAIGLSGFGGVLPIARHHLVERRQWLSGKEFTDLLSLAQVLPGPNVLILGIFFGTRTRGLIGAVVAFGGLVLMPVALVLMLAALYSEFHTVPAVSGAMSAISSGAAGLVVALALKMVWPILKAPRSVLLAGTVFIAVVVLRVPLLYVMALAAPVSVLLLWSAPDE